MCKQQPKSWYYCRILGSGFGWITNLFCRMIGSCFSWITDLFLQDSWILCLWFRDDRHLCGPAVGDHLPPGTPSQHPENQVGFWSARFSNNYLWTYESVGEPDLVLISRIRRIIYDNLDNFNLRNSCEHFDDNCHMSTLKCL